MADFLNSGMVVPEIFAAHVVKKTAEKSELITSGIAQDLGGVDIADGGLIVNLPFFNDLAGDSAVMSKGVASVAEYVNDSKDVAVVNARIKSWKSSDVDTIAVGQDPLNALADRVADYWAREYQRVAIASLNGIATELKVNTVGTGAKTAITSSMVVDAGFALGDNSDKITGYAMHSMVVANLLKQGLIQPMKLPTGAVFGYSLLGKRVIVDDSLPYDSAKKEFVSYAFGEGAFGYKELPIAFAAEVSRDAAKSETVLHSRRRFILHPRGVKWIGDVSATAPTNANLAANKNWQRVYEPKEVRIVRIHHGIETVDDAILKLVKALQK